MVLINVTKDNFKSEVEDSELPVLVDIFSPTCGPCRALLPVLNELSNEFDGKIKFVKINSAVSQELAQMFEVRAVPTLIFINNGQIIDQAIGYIKKERLRENINKLLEFLQKL
ncbi:thioredoxin [Candidatus Micrarchaeota archaeon]|jgi:thioredoxin|nr:thioredoxin [Candidatus Micrarchaeota archaeon]